MNRERCFWRPRGKDCIHHLFLNARASYEKHFSLVSAGKSSWLSSYPRCLDRVGQVGHDCSLGGQSAATQAHHEHADSKL